MRLLFLVFCSFLIAMQTSAQNNRITGTVTDAESGTPLPNASVRISGSGGTTTDKNGKFRINCSDSVTITISYIGYETFKQKVGCNSFLFVQMNQLSGNLDEIEVTATSNPDRRVLYQPASISVIGKNEIDRGTGLLLDDAINTNIPGVYMQRRTLSAGQQFNIRGYGNGTRGTNGINSNFDGQGYKVYLNGIPITDAEGLTLMDDIDFGSVGGVEIVKGPSGTLYGQAIAGVVNLTTIKPHPGTSSLGQKIILGSYGLQRYTSTLMLGKEKSSILVNYGKQKYNGFMPHTHSNKDFVNLSGEFTPNQKQAIHVYFGFSDSYEERNGEITKEQWEMVDYSGNPRYIKNNAHSNIISFRAGVGHTYRFSQSIANTTSVYGTGLTSNVSSAGGWTDKSSINYGLRSTFDTKFSLGDHLSVSGITGVEAQKQNAQTMGYPMVVDSFNTTGYNIIGTIRSNQYTLSKTLSLFSEWTLLLPEAFSITAGLGYSSLGIELNDRLYSSANNNPSNPNAIRKPVQYKKSFHNMLSPHLAINKVFAKQISVYAAFSTGYKAPVSSYFFIPVTGQLVPGLKPEKGTQFEVGSKGTLFGGRLNYQFAAFTIRFKDKMTTVAVADSTNTATSYVYVANAGEQNNTGIEMLIKGIAYHSSDFINEISPFVNIAVAHFRYGDFKYQQLTKDKKSIVEVDYSKKTVAGVPPVTFNTGFDLTTTPGLYMNITYSFRAKMYYTSDNLNMTGQNHLLNAKLGYKHEFGKHLGLDTYFGLNNITQNQNYAMVFLNQLPDAYIPAPNKINCFGGLNIKYIF